MRTLAALVPAAIEGVVRDVLLAAPAAGEALARIADHAGCEMVVAPPAELLAAAAARLKEPRVFVLRAGMAPQAGFIGELADLLAYRPDAPALLRAEPRSLLTRLAPGLARPAACVVPRAALQAGGAAPEVAAIARRLSAPVVLKARMIGVG
ncbi:MAG TPA: transposase [Beijerinckiaceae bacterium]